MIQIFLKTKANASLNNRKHRSQKDCDINVTTMMMMMAKTLQQCRQYIMKMRTIMSLIQIITETSQFLN